MVGEKKQDFRICVSQVVLDEAKQGDAEASARRMGFLADLDLLDLTDAVYELAEALLNSGVVPGKAARDSIHIAATAVHGMDYLLTWNCAHIANAEIERKVRQICSDKGFECPVICTPEELLGE